MAIQTILSFLGDLKENNNREWFDENRKRYQESKVVFEQFVELVILELGKIDEGVADLQAKNCVFRIFRDTRFSKDKTPYKTNFGGYFVKGGKNSPNAGYYIHLAPDGCFIGGGCYMPQGEHLKNIRLSIVDDPDFYKEIIQDPTFVNHFGSIKGEKVKTYPRGFDKNFSDIELIKNKQYFVSRELSMKEVTSDKFMPLLLETFKAMKPLNDFLNHAIDG